MQLILPSRRYVVMLTVFWIIALTLAPWIVFILRPMTVSTRNVLLAYLMFDPAIVLFVPMSFLLLGASERVYRATGHVKMSARFLVSGGFLGLVILPFVMGLIWFYGGVVSGSHVTVLLALSLCVGTAFLALRITTRAVEILLEDNGQD